MRLGGGLRFLNPYVHAYVVLAVASKALLATADFSWTPEKQYPTYSQPNLTRNRFSEYYFSHRVKEFTLNCCPIHSRDR